MPDTQLKKLITLQLLTLALALMLFGCGGSKQSNESQEAAPPSESSSPVAENIDDLVAASSFNFTSKATIALSINITELEGQRAHVNLYSQYQKIADGYYPSPSSRVISGTMSDGSYQNTFINTNQQQRYLLEIWRYDSSPPIQQELTIANAKLSL